MLQWEYCEGEKRRQVKIKTQKQTNKHKMLAFIHSFTDYRRMLHFVLTKNKNKNENKNKNKKTWWKIHTLKGRSDDVTMVA